MTEPEKTPKERALVAITTAIESRRAEFTMALAGRVDPDLFMSVALDAARSNPGLLDVILNTPDSMLKALYDAAALALVPNGVLGSAYIVPRRNKHTGRTEAYFQAGYRGLVELAIRSGHVARVESRVVYAGDAFDMAFGTSPTIEHRPVLADDDRGPILGVYAVAFMRDGGRLVEWMTAAQIDAIRRRSPARDSGPWVTDYEEMCRKTVVRRLCKSLPMSAEVQRAIALDDSAIDSDEPAQPEEPRDATLADRIRKAKVVSPSAPGTGDDQPGAAEAIVVGEAVLRPTREAIEQATAAQAVADAPVTAQEAQEGPEPDEPGSDAPDEDEPAAVASDERRTFVSATKPHGSVQEWIGSLEPGPKGIRFAYSTWKSALAYPDDAVRVPIESIGGPTPATISGVLDYVPWEKAGVAQPPYRKITVYAVTM